jgi:hypothetical protein
MDGLGKLASGMFTASGRTDLQLQATAFVDIHVWVKADWTPRCGAYGFSDLSLTRFELTKHLIRFAFLYGLCSFDHTSILVERLFRDGCFFVGLNRNLDRNQLAIRRFSRIELTPCQSLPLLEPVPYPELRKVLKRPTFCYRD